MTYLRHSLGFRDSMHIGHSSDPSSRELATMRSWNLRSSYSEKLSMQCKHAAAFVPPCAYDMPSHPLRILHLPPARWLRT